MGRICAAAQWAQCKSDQRHDGSKICRSDDDDDDDDEDAVTRRLKKVKRGNRSGESWTAAEDALVKEMSERGCTDTEIARCLPGRTVIAVQYRLVRSP